MISGRNLKRIRFQTFISMGRPHVLGLKTVISLVFKLPLGAGTLLPSTFLYYSFYSPKDPTKLTREQRTRNLLYQSMYSIYPLPQECLIKFPCVLGRLGLLRLIPLVKITDLLLL